MGAPLETADGSGGAHDAFATAADSDAPRSDHNHDHDHDGSGAGVHPTSKVDGDGGDDDTDEAVERRRNSQVQALARHYTTASHASGVSHTGGRNVFEVALGDADSPLNPSSANFKARSWAKAVAALVTGEGRDFRTTGVCFQNLNVFGFGAGTDYQKSVANVWFEAAGLASRLFGGGRRRIDILRQFDGIVRPGEMLVVLGPPGAGCSTLLKTIAGETNGIYVDDQSYFNYQGAPAPRPRRPRPPPPAPNARHSSRAD